MPGASKWLWIGLGLSALLAAFFCRTRRSGVPMALLMAATVGIGAGWYVVRLDFAAPDDLAARLGDEPRLVRVTGVAQGSPALRERTAGSMGSFDYRPSSMYFPMRVEALLDRDGVVHPVRGFIYVGVRETIAPFSAGARIEAQGYLSTPSAPLNPGEFDVRRLARALGQAGTLNVPSRELVTVRPPEHGDLRRRFIQARETVRRRAGGWLLADLPGDRDGRRAALLSALLLGRRELRHEGVSESFRRIGLAHLLAISGLHLGVLAGFVLTAVRLLGVPVRWHGWIMIFVVAGYLFLVEVRLPVLRAGVMTMAASLALITGRRLRVGGLVSLSAIPLLLWRPEQLFTPGFQLSYGVVAGIVHFSPGIRVRWFGPPDQVVASSMQMIGQWGRTTVAVTVTAWMIAMPITAYHFGVVTPLAVPLSLVALPLVAVLLAVGYAKMVLALLLPSAALLLGVPLSVGSDVLLSVIEAIDELPGTTWHIPHPSPTWAACALGSVVLWARYRGRFRFTILGAVLIGLCTWGLWPLLPTSNTEALRIDMLAVGDGTCLVVRDGRHCALFDAGSSTDLNAGDRMIVPALRRLGVRRIDFIAVSHANLDHYSAVLEVTAAFDVDEVLVTPQMLDTVRRDPDGATAFLLERLTARRVRIREIAAGATRRLGGSTWRWLHPGRTDRFSRSNDASMVIRIEAGGRTVLLTGDIQRDAIAGLLDAERDGAIDLSADVIELPHHGSFNPAAAALLERIAPAVVMQSTGRRRWNTDRWGGLLDGSERLVTSRDGACTVRIDAAGNLDVSRYLEDPKP